MHIKHGPRICPVTPVCDSSRSDLLLWKNRNDTGHAEEKAELLSIHAAVILPGQSKKDSKKPESRQRKRPWLKHDNEEDEELPQR